MITTHARRVLFFALAWAAIAGQASAAPFSTTALSATYKDVQVFMQSVAKQFPKTAKVFDLGLSDSGDMIQGLVLGGDQPAGAVKNLVVGTHHGNEYGATEVTKAFALSVARSPIPGQIVYVIPVLNISGFNARDRYENLNGEEIDPNRDYPGPCGTSGPFKLKSTHALANFIDTQGIVASATLHTYYPAVVYPWGISTQEVSTPYDDLFKQLVSAATVESQYQTGNSTEVIYPADGCYEDYAFWKDGIWSLLFELGTSHTPSEAEVDQMIQVNVPGLRRFLQQAPRQRAEKHEFTGRCDGRLRGLDRHDE